jgi:hypothetical protein
MDDVWKVMHIRNGKVEAIGKAAGLEAPGAVLRIEARDYAVVFSEGDLNGGWIYVTSLFKTNTPAAARTRER